MTSYFSSLSASLWGSPNRCWHNFSEWRHQKRGNLLNSENTDYTRVVGVTVLILVLVSVAFSLLLVFMVRCDESKLLSSSKDQNLSLQRMYGEISKEWLSHVKTREETYMARKLEWVPSSLFNKDHFEPAGNERNGELLLYVGRASFGGEVMVGKYLDSHGGAYIGYGGKEHYRPNCEILSYPKGTMSWIEQKVGDELPPKSTMVSGGSSSSTREVAYVCRLKANTYGRLLIGQIFPKNGSCFAPFDDVEHTAESFEILVINAMGKLLGIDS